MRNIWLVAKHSIRTTLRKRAFWITTFLMPALMLGFLAYSELQDSRAEASANDQAAGTQGSSLSELPTIGLVDDAGLTSRMPDGFPPDLFVRFRDDNAARIALEAGEVGQYVFIPADYLATGEITVYDQGFQIARSGDSMGVGFGSPYAWVLSDIINFNLMGDAQLAVTLRNPTPGTLVERHVLRPPLEGGPEAQAMAQIIARLMPYVFYFVLLMGSGYLMQSVTAEKENRTAEVLLLSLQPRDLMMGKVLGLGVVTLIQLLAWLGSGLLILSRSVDWLNAPALDLPPSFFAWAALYVLLGYMLYGGVMAAAGAMAPTAREGGQVTILLVLPLLPTLMFASEFAQNPHGMLAVVLSLFPFSAPSAMVTRLAVTGVPFWQLAASLSGLAVTAYLFIGLAGRFFRADNLLSGVSFTWRRFMTGWRAAHKAP